MDLAKSKKAQDAIFKTFIYSFLFVGAISMAIPYAWMFVTSIKPIEEIQSYPPSFIVKNPTALPYQDLFRLIPMWRYLFNSVYVAGAVTLANIFFCSLAGYAFAKHRFWGRDNIFIVLLGSLMIPWQVNLISGFVLMRNLLVFFVNMVFKVRFQSFYLSEGWIVPTISNAFQYFSRRFIS